MQAEVTERDLDLFLTANSQMNKKKDDIERNALLNVFTEPFRIARHSFLERQTIIENHRSLTDGLNQ